MDEFMDEVSKVFEKDHPKLAKLCIQARNEYDGQSEEEKDLAFKEIVTSNCRREGYLFGMLLTAHLMFRDNAEARFREATPFEDRKEQALKILRVEGVDGENKELLLRAFLGEYTEKFLAAV